jgi:dihydrolipoamide dehydrogenase
VTVEARRARRLRADQIWSPSAGALVAISASIRGVAVERGFVKVGRRTSAEGVAIGDCGARRCSPAGVARVSRSSSPGAQAPIDPKKIACIYCQPQVASIGLSEAEARAAGHDVKVGKAPFVASGKAVGSGHTEGFVKLVSDAKYGEILGCQIIGHGATELINEVALAMTLESTLHEVGETSHAHPTLSEMLMEAALAAEDRALNF